MERVLLNALLFKKQGALKKGAKIISSVRPLSCETFFKMGQCRTLTYSFYFVVSKLQLVDKCSMLVADGYRIVNLYHSTN